MRMAKGIVKGPSTVTDCHSIMMSPKHGPIPVLYMST